LRCRKEHVQTRQHRRPRLLGRPAIARVADPEPRPPLLPAVVRAHGRAAAPRTLRS
jgi:hypothetical protein